MEDYVIDVMKSVVLEKPKVQKIREDGEFLVVRDNNKKIVILNVTGKEIYKICGGLSIGEVISKMKSEYDVEAKKLSIDVLNFVRDMERKGLLVLR
ncbi:MAG: PqqD family peptide modification chaperone [Candidatus Aenigmarchaeota archaeon]|nr:PqqD family peptide modification chaperone [Candidatus Aenigmarchaeota archaeon]